MTLREAVLVEGEDAQTNTMRWEDYTQTAIDPTTTARSGTSATTSRRARPTTRPGSARSGYPAASDSRRSAVICACSFAATPISIAGEFLNRVRSIASISSAVRPVAQTMKV